MAVTTAVAGVEEEGEPESHSERNGDMFVSVAISPFSRGATGW